MALLDFLKKKEEAKKAKRPAKKTVKVSVGKKIEAPVKQSVPKASPKAKSAKFSYEAVRQPHISEKASYLAEKDQYVFDVSPNFNKNEVKNAVEGLYKVDVLSVNVIKIPAKKRRLGRTQGWRKSYKKAIVKIKNGQKIEIL